MIQSPKLSGWYGSLLLLLLMILPAVARIRSRAFVEPRERMFGRRT
jgi:hypothetical protein